MVTASTYTYLDKTLFLLSQVHVDTLPRDVNYPAAYVNRNLLLARSRVTDSKDHANPFLVCVCMHIGCPVITI